MHEVNDVVVRDGKLILSQLPFADGQHVRVMIDASSPAQPEHRISIAEARHNLKGGVVRYDDPFEPVIPPDQWEMLR